MKSILGLLCLGLAAVNAIPFDCFLMKCAEVHCSYGESMKQGRCCPYCERASSYVPYPSPPAYPAPSAGYQQQPSVIQPIYIPAQSPSSGDSGSGGGGGGGSSTADLMTVLSLLGSLGGGGGGGGGGGNAYPAPPAYPMAPYPSYQVQGSSGPEPQGSNVYVVSENNISVNAISNVSIATTTTTTTTAAPPP